MEKATPTTHDTEPPPVEKIDAHGTLLDFCDLMGLDLSPWQREFISTRPARSLSISIDDGDSIRGYRVAPMVIE